MAQQRYQRQALEGGAPNGGGHCTKLARPRGTDFRHILAAWAGIIVLVFNLFGWTLTALPEAAPRPSAGMVETIFGESALCQHSTNQPSDHRDNHGKLLCPACFPLGNASVGALSPVAPAILIPFDPLIVRQDLPDDTSAHTSFHPYLYQARAPPQAV